MFSLLIDISKKKKSLATTVQKFRTKYGQNSDSTSSTVKRVIQEFKQNGSIGDAKHIVHSKTNPFKRQY